MENFSGQKLCLKWDNYLNTIASALEELRSRSEFVDVTLWCEGRALHAHKIVLSACSPYFRIILENLQVHTAVVLHGIPYADLHKILDFMYLGQTSLCESHLVSFLKSAEILQVTGLSPTNAATSETTNPDEYLTTSLPRLVPETQFLAAALRRPKPPVLVSSPPSPCAVANPNPPKKGLGSSGRMTNCTVSMESSKRKCPDDTNQQSFGGFLSIPQETPSPFQQTTPSILYIKEEILIEPDDNDRLSCASGLETTESQPENSYPSNQEKDPLKRNSCSSICPHCKIDNYSLSALRYHVRTIHSDPSKEYFCCYCPTVFSTRMELTAHNLASHNLKF